MPDYSNINWEMKKKIYPINSIVQGTVAHHAHFGFFVDISDNDVVGLIEIVNFIDGEKIVTINMFPPVGTFIIAKIIGYREERLDSNQILMTTKPSEIRTAIDYDPEKHKL